MRSRRIVWCWKRETEVTMDRVPHPGVRDGATTVTNWAMRKILSPSTDMEKLGQHFLRNAAVLEDIVEAIGITEGEHIIEIGPGHGELTAPLVRAAFRKNCEIVCIEKDRTLIGDLNDMAGIKIVEGDALKLVPEIASRFLRDARYKIAGNIPYYITGKLLRVISELERKPDRAVFLLQKEV